MYGWVSVVLVNLCSRAQETGLFRFINASSTPQKVYATILRVLSASVFLFVLVGLMGVGGIADFLGYASQPGFVGIFVIIVGLDALMSIPFAYLRYQHKPLRFAFYKFLFILLNIGFNLLFWYSSPTL